MGSILIKNLVNINGVKLAVINVTNLTFYENQNSVLSSGCDCVVTARQCLNVFRETEQDLQRFSIMLSEV